MSERHCDVAIIGGGPAGGHAASLISKAGYSVTVFEEHASVGEPVQCAGLITPRCFDVLGYGNETILNKIVGADIMSPSGQFMGIGREGAQAVVVDRAAFDRRIIDRAKDNGASLQAGTRVESFERKGGRIAINGGLADARIIIGADGAKSATRRWLGISEPEFFLNGFGAELTGAEIDSDRVKLFFGKDIAPNFFAWLIPAGDTVRAGICIRGGNGTVYDYYKGFLRLPDVEKSIRGGKMVRQSAGIIPLGTLSGTSADNAMLLGDAACQVKATSGGGIYPGLICAGHCAQAAIRALEMDDCSARPLSRYHEAWSSDIGKELEKALMMHRVYSSLDDTQLEDIFRMMLNPEIQELINKVGDIDYPSKLAWAVLRKEPRLLRYTGQLLKHGILNL